MNRMRLPMKTLTTETKINLLLPRVRVRRAMTKKGTMSYSISIHEKWRNSLKKSPKKETNYRIKRRKKKYFSWLYSKVSQHEVGEEHVECLCTVREARDERYTWKTTRISRRTTIITDFHLNDSQRSFSR